MYRTKPLFIMKKFTKNIIQNKTLIMVLAIILLACNEEKISPALSIESVTPTNAEENISVDTGISIHFNQQPSASGLQDFITVKQHDLPLNVSGAYDVDANIITFTPFESLAYGKIYTCEVKAGLTAPEGGALAESFTWSFVTEDDPLIGTWDYVSGESYAGAYIIFHPSGSYDESNGTIFFSWAFNWKRESKTEITISRSTAGPLTVYPTFNEDKSTLTLQWNTYGTQHSVTYQRR